MDKMRSVKPPSMDASVGAITRWLGITARAVRFYEEKGLISAARDRWNRRRYDPETQRQIEWIVRLRRCGVGLSGIRRVLEAERAGQPLTPVALTMLRQKLQQLDAERSLVSAEVDSVFARSLREDAS